MRTTVVLNVTFTLDAEDTSEHEEKLDEIIVLLERKGWEVEIEDEEILDDVDYLGEDDDDDYL